MVRDEQDRTASWDPIQSGDLDARREMIQGPARCIGQRPRGEGPVRVDELARNPARRWSEECAHGRTTGTAMFPAKSFDALTRKDACQQLELIHRTPSTLRAMFLSEGFALAAVLRAECSSARIAARVSRSSSS